MSTSAIQLAFQLAKQPKDMNWLFLSDSPLPKGITDLLRLCASSKQLEKFSNNINVNSITIRKILVSFIEKVLVNESNSSEKILGLDPNQPKDRLKLHYRLLIRIFHPDISISTQASYKTSLITKAYKKQKEESQHFKNIKLSRIPPKSFYYATKKAAKHHSSLKNTFLVFSGMTVISLGIILSYLLDGSSPELVANSQQLILTSEETSSDSLPNHQNKIEKANYTKTSSAEKTEAVLQKILRDIESYYEDGNVQRIKPILANTPEMQNQSDEQMQKKLEALFKMTKQRKMVFYNFKWRNISGQIKGVGKFISRYQMTDQTSWQTREGVATVTAEGVSDSLSVTGLTLENNIIE